jgi:hypothetical protein
MKKYNHVFDVAFQFDSDNDAENVTEEELRTALNHRLATLDHFSDVEVFGHVDTVLNEPS